MSESRERDRSAIGCYGLIAFVVLAIAAAASIGTQAPEKNELNIEIAP